MAMKLYIINLKRARDRRAHMEAQIGGLEHEFIDAVDARTLNREDWPEMPADQPLGAVAAALSHLRAYEAILRDGRTGIVLEDDAILPDKLPDIPLEEGVALLSYRNLPSRPYCRLRGPGPLLEPLDPIISGTAYAITPQACAVLLDFHPAKHGRCADDWSFFPVKVRCVEGRPVGHGVQFSSSIGYRNGRLIPNWLRTINRRRIDRSQSRFVIVP